MIRRLILMFLLFATAGISHAQEAEVPLVFSMRGDIWTWTESTGQLEQLTTWGYNERPVLSPDGRYIAYNSWAQITVEGIAQGQPAIGAPPSNIWVMDLTTGEAFRTQDQPEGAAYVVTDGFGPSIIRSEPVWSPDGAALAWIQIILPEFQWQIARFDMSSRSLSIIVPELPPTFADGGIYVPPIDWGQTGIAYRTFQFTENGSSIEDILYIYDSNGDLMSRSVVAASSGGGMGGTVVTHFAVIHEGREMIAIVHGPSSSITLFDPSTRTLTGIDSELELYVPKASSPLAVRLSMLFDEGLRFSWSISNGDSLLPLDYSEFPERRTIAISPSGESIAYLTDALYVWKDGEVQKIPGTEGGTNATTGGLWISSGLDWGQMSWRLTPGEISQPSCSNSPQPRLAPGMKARVIPNTTPNALRSGPGTDEATSVVVGEIPAGATFVVIYGPECGNEGRAWYQVDYNGEIGFTAEGEGDTYWIEPLLE